MYEAYLRDVGYLQARLVCLSFICFIIHLHYISFRLLNVQSYVILTMCHSPHSLVISTLVLKLRCEYLAIHYLYFTDKLLVIA